MEKYIVSRNDTVLTGNPRLDPFEQDFIVIGPNGHPYKRHCMNTQGLFEPGDVIKVYKTNHEMLPMECACSYKLGGKYYVELAMKPMHFIAGEEILSNYGVRKFYDQLSFMDGVRLNHDIVRVLRQRKIRPSIFWENNLRMFLQRKM